MSRVTLTNPFDLLTDENEDRTNVPAPKPSKEQKPAPAKPAAKPAATGAAAPKPAAAKPAAPKPEVAKAPAAKPADAKPAPKPQPTGNAPSQPPPRDANQNLQEKDKEHRQPRERKERGPAYPPADPRKRLNDRKSGTGRPQNEVKKGGQGKGNWGGEVDVKDGAEALKEKEEKLDEKDEADESKEGEKKEGETPKDEEKKEGGEPPKEEEKKPEPPEELTYDEYLAKRKKAPPPKGVEALKPRTVTADDFSAAGFVPLERGEGGAPPLLAKEKKEKKEKPAASEKAEKPEKSEKKEGKNLAAQLLTFATHQDEKRRERISNPRSDYGGPRDGPRDGHRDGNRDGPRDGHRDGNRDGPRDGPRDGNRDGNSRGGGERRGPRTDRPPRDFKNSSPAAPTGTQLPAQKDFPALGPHGSDQPVKA